jgi:hypothetical protein
MAVTLQDSLVDAIAVWKYPWILFQLLVPEVCEILSMEVANMNSTEVEKVKESWSENEDLAEEI